MGIFAFQPELGHERFPVTSDKVCFIIRYFPFRIQHLLSYKQISVMKIVLIQCPVSANEISLPVIRHRKPVIEPFFHIIRFHNLPFIELYMACPWIGILISCAFSSSFSDDCCKACREKIRSCASKRKIFSQATKPLQGPPCAIIRKNNYLCCKK